MGVTSAAAVGVVGWPVVGFRPGPATSAGGATKRQAAQKSFTRKVDADRYRAEVEVEVEVEVEHSLNTGSYIDPKAGKVTFRSYAEAWRGGPGPPAEHRHADQVAASPARLPAPR
ncbi:hypothetical protein KIF24_12275 [Micromonospora sp. Llam7]|uniref:hypothetical protein n=1 Tax=Micromonospora tarapacensis TaxID=2835305 RepID=UPI001C82A00F|nr:hypothetical protein [Micromonospora tarapacensis]MBX7266733.1 hypothetical protein [Micromonospora tarapacensis]